MAMSRLVLPLMVAGAHAIARAGMGAARAGAAVAVHRGTLALRNTQMDAAPVVTRSVAALRTFAAPPRSAVVLQQKADDAVEEKEEEDRLGAGGRGGHQVRNAPELSEEEKAVQAKVMAHQQDAARLSKAEDSRSLVAYSTGYGVLSTMSKSLPGFPSGSVVGFAIDDKGLPIFCFSGMSGHTQDLLASPDAAPAALTVTANDFKGAAEGRVTLVGTVRRVPSDEADPLREIYRAKHPNAFWVDFGDFSWFKMDELKAVRFVGGFARAGDMTPEEYMQAEVDPIQAFAKPVMEHMNADHSDATTLMVQHYIGLPEVEDAKVAALDRLGMTVQVTRKGQSFKLRLPFPRPAESRKDVKTLIVEMTQASAKATQAQ